MIRHRLTFVLKESDKEKGGGKLNTVPNESLSMREIFMRFAKGQSTGGAGFTFRGSEPVFTMDERSVDFDAPDLEKLNKMDQVEKDQVLHETKVRRGQLEKKAKENQRQRDQQVKDQKIREENELLDKLSKRNAAPGGRDTDKGASKGGTE